MKKRLLSITLVFVLVFSLVSCAAKLNDAAEFNASTDMKYESSSTSNGFFDGLTGSVKDDYFVEAEESYDAEMPSMDSPMEEPSAPESTAAPDVTAGRKIIYSSSFNLETKEYDKSVLTLESLCSQYGAWFENSNSRGTAEYGNRYSYYTIRVPVENYNAFIASQSNVGVVVSSSENNRDVTEQYTDIEARLASAALREERVLKILENADRLDDVLALERELSDIRYEIESYTGSLRKYDSLVSYATVTVSLSEVAVITPTPPATLTFGERLAKGFKSGIENFIDGLEDFAVEFSYNFIGIIIWIVIIVVVIIIVRNKIKKHRAKKSTPTAVPEEKKEENK